MKVTDYKCNICKEYESACDEFIGIESDDDCTWKQVPIADAEIHICHPCLQELHLFFAKLAGNDHT